MSRINVGKVCPIPKGAWDQTQSYEKLNMVNKSGVLYIAKQDVPANTAITNTNYWMQANGSLSIGTVETVSSSTPASATISDSTNGPVLNLSIPRGVTGNESIDDTKGFGDIDYVWSADKSYNEINNKLDANNSIKTGNIVEFDAKTDYAIKDLTVGIEPVQDLHGQSNPYPEGGGKNILPLTVARLKSDNVAGTWSGNVYSYNGITFEVLTDNGGNVSGIKVNGTASADASLNLNNLNSLLSATSYVVNGCPSGGSSSTYFDYIRYSGFDTGSGGSVNYTSEQLENAIYYSITIKSGTAISNKTFYPMVRLASVTDATFAPYANVCPISGHSSAVVTRTGKNLNPNTGVNLSTNTSTRFFVKAGQTYVFSTNNGASIQLGELLYIGLWDSQTSGTNITKGALTSSTMTLNGSETLYYSDFDISSCAFTMQKSGWLSIGFNNRTPTNYTDCQIELGSSASAYEPYTGTSVTVDLDDTRYGGSLDVTTGVLTVTHGIISDLSQLTWNQHDARTTAYYATSNTLNLKTYNNMISSVLKGVSATTTIGSMPDNSVRSDQSADNYIYVNSTIASNVPSFTASMSGVQLVYELATPVSVTLTPAEVASLIGHNVLWCDTGNSTVTLRLATGDLAYQDDIDYTSSQLKNKPTLGTMASKDDATSDTKAYGRKDGAWYDLDGRYYTESETDDKLAAKADIIHTSASGAIAHITDGAAYPVDSLSVDIDPVQDLNGYDAPWPAGGGKNLYPNSAISGTQNGLTVSQSGDKYTLSASNQSGYAQFISTDSFILSAGTYTISLFGGTNTNIAFQLRSTDGLTTYGSAILGNHATFTLSADTEVKPRITSNVTGAVSYTVTAQIESGSSPTSYAPYSNICPISGHSSATVTRTGKNLLDPALTNDVNTNYCTVTLSDNVYTLHATNADAYFGELVSVGSSYASRDGTKQYVKAGHAYKLVVSDTRFNKNYVSFFNSENVVIANLKCELNAFTVPEGTAYMTFRFGYASTVSGTDYTFTVMLVDASETDSTFEPYQGTSVTISLGSTYYGAQLDVLTGTLTVDRVFWTKNTSTMNNNESYPGWSSSGIKDIVGSGKNGAIVGIRSNIAPISGTHGEGKNYYSVNTTLTNDIIYLPTGTWNGKLQSQWIADAVDIQLVIPLITPTVITGLTPAQMSLLLGENNVFTDTGNTEVTYIADSKMYIDKKFAELQALILENS